MPLPRSFITVTPFSKLLAMFLFITLPLIGLYVGMSYEKTLNSYTKTVPELSKPPANTTEDWVDYANGTLGVAFKHPNWTIQDDTNTDPESIRIHMYSPGIINALPHIPESEKENYSITVSKWKEKVGDPFVLFSQFENNVYAIGHYSYLNRNKDNMYQVLFADGSSHYNGDVYAERDAFFLDSKGLVIHIKPGKYVGKDRNFYLQLLNSFTFIDASKTTSTSAVTDPKWVRKNFYGTWNIEYPQAWQASDVETIYGFLQLTGTYSNNTYEASFAYPMGGFTTLDDWISKDLTIVPHESRSQVIVGNTFAVGNTTAKKVTNIYDPAIDQVIHKVYIWKGTNNNPRTITLKQTKGMYDSKETQELLDRFVAGYKPQ